MWDVYLSQEQRAVERREEMPLKKKTYEKIINNTTTKHNKCYLSILFVLCRATGMLEPIPDISGDRQGNTLDRWLVHHRDNAQTD